MKDCECEECCEIRARRFRDHLADALILLTVILGVGAVIGAMYLVKILLG